MDHLQSQIHKASIFKMSKKNKWYCFLGVNNFRRKWDVLTKHLHIINKVRYKNNGNQCWNRSDLSTDSNRKTPDSIIVARNKILGATC